MRLPSYSVTGYRHGRTYGSTSARLKYASRGDPARGPACATNGGTLLTGTGATAILPGSKRGPSER